MTVPFPSRPRTALDLSDPGLWERGVPHEEFTRLRRASPVAWNDRRDGHAGFWAVTTHDEIVSVSRDTERFSSRNGVISLDDFDDEQSEVRRTLLEMDPPQHTLMRRITAGQFTPRAVRAFEEFVRGTAVALIDDALRQGTCDAVAVVSKHLPIRTLCRVMGIPSRCRDDMIRWSDAVIGVDDPEYVDPAAEAVPAPERRLLPFGHPASLEAFGLGRQLAAERRRRPIPDVVTALALGRANGRELTDGEFCNYFLMLVVAGNETTRHSISHGLGALATHPEEWGRFRTGQIDSHVAADEILRWASAVNFVRRIATRDAELAGVSIRAGEKVVMYYSSANRDEKHFGEPQRFVIDRTPNNHVAFGKGGPHFCLGAHLARLQIRVVLEELARRVGRLEPAGQPDRLRSNHIHGIKHLPLTFVADR